MRLNMYFLFRDEIELQVLDSARSRGRMAPSHCLIEMRDVSPSSVAGIGLVETCGVGEYFNLYSLVSDFQWKICMARWGF